MYTTHTYTHTRTHVHNIHVHNTHTHNIHVHNTHLHTRTHVHNIHVHNTHTQYTCTQYTFTHTYTCTQYTCTQNTYTHNIHVHNTHLHTRTHVHNIHVHKTHTHTIYMYTTHTYTHTRTLCTHKFFPGSNKSSTQKRCVLQLWATSITSVTERGRGLYRSGEDPHGPGVLLEPDSDIVFGHMGGRPGSADLSHHTSSSNSPVKCKDASDCQHWSGSLSSDDVLGLSQSQQTLSRSATLPYDHSPQQAQPQRRNRNRARPSSPGSEMVTLEEFLQESSVTSPQVVSLGSKEDLMKDYFTRSPDPTGSDHVTPTSYVTPTVHTSTQRPGQSVKPSPRQPVGQSPGSSGPVTPRGQQSLSRTFSLASADLLRSNGPDTFQEGGTPKQPDLVIRRQGGARGRERPLSARLAGSGSILASPVHHSSSLTLQTEREGDRGRTPVTHRAPPSTCHHRGEVAMVTPVRAVSASQLGEASAQDDHPSDSFQSPDAERPGCSTVQVQRPTSTPASPDPNNDPQTVWYEYGCV
ncbi:protein Daple-like [Nerophis ophidion]|uniref:protein Daple-like n=1 Tax=Nerophis ophidion TaxID=159077 RepID=UPI002AE04EE8|nr:protein Daple-like [Nerophis ophidion]